MTEPELLQIWAEHLEQARNGLHALINAQDTSLRQFERSGDSLAEIMDELEGTTWQQMLDYGETLLRDAARELQQLQTLGTQGVSGIQSFLEDAALWPPNPTVYDPGDVAETVQPALQ